MWQLYLMRFGNCPNIIKSCITCANCMQGVLNFHLWLIDIVQHSVTPYRKSWLKCHQRFTLLVIKLGPLTCPNTNTPKCCLLHCLCHLHARVEWIELCQVSVPLILHTYFNIDAYQKTCDIVKFYWCKYHVHL